MKERGAAKAHDVPRLPRTHDGDLAGLIVYDDPASSRLADAAGRNEQRLPERHDMLLLLRTAADGVARKTYELEQLADRTRGVSQATVYKALQALEKERAIFAELEGRVDTASEQEWESFKKEAFRALDAVREPDEEPAARQGPAPAGRRNRVPGSATGAKH